MSRLNVKNRTLAIMDNLPFLRSLNNECIDLIAIDPPFAANETFTQKPKPPITLSELAEEKALAEVHGVAHNEGVGETRVKDYWTWDEDVHPAWKARIEDDYPAVHAVIQAVEACASENEAAYIAFMAARLIECHRVLKPTGSIYVHCDSHANGYLRMLLEAVFGSANFRNEIVWQRTTAHNDSGRFGANADTILFYTKSNQWTWNNQHQPYDEKYKARFKRQDPDGRAWADYDITAKGLSGGGYEYEYKGAKSLWRVPLETMERLDAEDRLHFTRTGGIRQKRYLDELEGRPVQAIWTDIQPINSQAKERTGYATQKPLTLYERIIKASSNPGDVVLDIFAGCATTAVAAERLERQWIACDMAYRAWTMLKRRFYLKGYALTDMTDATRSALSGKKAKLPEFPSVTIGPYELPSRNDVDPVPAHHLVQARRGKKGSHQSASWSGRYSKEDAKAMLIKKFGPVCWGCGYEPRRPNGTLDDTLLEVDHIRARKASEGKQGNDELYNLALLHPSCNRVKRNKLTLEDLRNHNAFKGLLYVNGIGDLIDLYEAVEFANEQIATHIMERGAQKPRVYVSTNPPTRADIAKMNEGDQWIVRSEHPYVPEQ